MRPAPWAMIARRGERRAVSCLPLRRQLAAFVDGEVPAWEVLPLLEHLEHCGACRRLVMQEVALRDAIRRALRDVTMPSWLVARVSAAIAITARDLDEEP